MSFSGNSTEGREEGRGAAWSIQRTGRAQAIATAEGGAIDALAPLTGFDCREFGKWLEPDDGQPLPETSSLPLQNRRFRIPNTVCAIWAGNLGRLGRWWVEWPRNIARLRSRGFRVLEFDATGNPGGNVAMEAFLERAGGLKELHGLYFWGHGNKLGQYGTKKTTVLAAGRLHLPYRLALTAILACESNVAVRQIASGAEGSLARGHDGVLVPVFPGWRFHLRDA